MIALILCRGILGKGFPLKELWNKQWAPRLFSQVMSRDRFLSLLKFIRFDDKNTRQSRLRNNKFALFSDIWERFIQNSQKCFNPGAFMTIDEQLYPTKVRCKFIQYMANKPDKFGIKFFLLANVEKPYVCNGFPYLGSDDTRPPDIQMAHHVVKQLIDPYRHGGYNITLDNFFTSKKLAIDCLSNNITIIGTVRNNRRELPANIAQLSHSTGLHTTLSFESDGCVLTTYKSKRNKSVHLFSTYHTNIEFYGPKNKPSTVIDYNKTKYGVDVIDQMARNYSCKISGRRWPLQVFCNVLDLAAINAFTLFTSVTGATISRRRSLLQLVSEIVDLQVPVNERIADIGGQTLTRKKCQIMKCSGNKTTSICSMCKKFTFGKCRSESAIICKNCCD